MNILAERIIEYLKTDTTLVALLSDSVSIFAEGVPDRKEKYVTVSTDVGEDLNYALAQEGTVIVTAIVSRTVANGHINCINIAKRIDDLLNRSESSLSNSEWSVINMIRLGGSQLMIDDTANEFYFPIEYRFLLDESVS